MPGRFPLLSLAAAGLLTVTPAGAQAPVAPSPTAVDPVYIDGATAAEKAQLQALLSETVAVLNSAEFHANLKSLKTTYPDVFLNAGHWNNPTPANTVNVSVDELSDVVAGKAPKYRYVRAPVALASSETNGDFTPIAGWTGSVTAQDTSLTLGREQFRRWRSADPVERSCAVNTVAHEISHLVADHAKSPTQFWQAVIDSKAKTLTTTAPGGAAINPPNAVASYLIGTVAQCTWLQRQGYTPTVDLKACVQAFGHRGFNKLRCASFAGAQAVAIRPGLPTAHDITD
ncbi:hypothetical protein [Phenylobacterium sp.]|jgi:hypothetical protein|uniref:hypothetical protein n=1 Tax=Phenylobacterium sp. TaxID=1871053 RepID=UPI002F923078